MQVNKKISVQCDSNIMDRIKHNYNAYRIGMFSFFYGLKNENEAYELFKSHVIFFNEASYNLKIDNANAYFDTNIMSGNKIESNSNYVELEEEMASQIAEHTYRSGFYQECIKYSTSDMSEEIFMGLLDKMAYHTLLKENLILSIGNEIKEVNFIEKRAYL